jgi:hypothetical protein
MNFEARVPPSLRPEEMDANGAARDPISQVNVSVMAAAVGHAGDLHVQHDVAVVVDTEWMYPVEEDSVLQEGGARLEYFSLQSWLAHALFDPFLLE